MTGLEVTTCLRRGEIEVATTFAPAAEGRYGAFEAKFTERFGDLIHSRDGETIDEIVARLLAGRSLAVAESCTGGLLAARLTDRAGASGWFLGGVTAYSNSAKIQLAGVDPLLIEEFGAVSDEVAAALADGARERFAAEYGVGVTGIAGPDGGSAEKPVGLVCFAVSGPAGSLVRNVVIPGGRADVRDRSTTIALHLVRRALVADQSS